MDKKKIMTIIYIFITLFIMSIAVYLIINNKNCERYKYGNCPVGCIVSSSGQNTEDIGCFPSDHEKNWVK